MSILLPMLSCNSIPSVISYFDTHIVLVTCDVNRNAVVDILYCLGKHVFLNVCCTSKNNCRQKISENSCLDKKRGP